ncbi:hypothetical protein AJ79_09213 [Helicocarpus griseus UAMH5409]|uniref:Fe2OG dioxygenase domain-containing protein n=1 Tax=Helicocarpus griseus UAMH5409 TaxID=1447875 RepID=A0A2B7WLL5_9EURO|nr:hypothetical protein AJ79_09213 [Helicocarpus griseus UAMH5409]
MATNSAAAHDQYIISSSLPTLRLDLLRAGDNAESKKLLDACRTYGFFYLDLTSDSTLCQYWEKILAVMKQYFEQPLEVKIQDAHGSDNTGYEPIGNEVGPNPATRDGYESLKVSRREFLKNEVELSTSIRDRSDTIFRFIREAHGITMMMLERLSNEMDLEASARFESFHADTRPTLSTLAFLRYPKHDGCAPDNVGHNMHTDIGSLTFLLTQQWGLQILSPGSDRWEFVKPRLKHAVINVGDSLHFPSGGQFASVVHRVIPFEGKQQEDRYSIAYLMRVNDDVRWSDRSGKVWSAKEWHDFKFDAFRTSDTMENGIQVVTGMRA